MDYTAWLIPDIERNSFCFTDGCGQISLGLAERIARTIGIPISDKVGRLLREPDTLQVDFVRNRSATYLRLIKFALLDAKECWLSIPNRARKISMSKFERAWKNSMERIGRSISSIIRDRVTHSCRTSELTLCFSYNV